MKTSPKLRPVRAPIWQWKMHVSGTICKSLWRDDELGVQRETWCRRRGEPPMCTYSKSKTAFFIAGDKRQFKTQAELMAALFTAKPEAK